MYLYIFDLFANEYTLVAIPCTNSRTPLWEALLYMIDIWTAVCLFEQ